MSEQGIKGSKRGWTKARAVLAGGLVLGVGAAITLAAWTDQEWAKGIFASGTFGIEGSADGTTFGNHATEGAADTLNFQVDANKLAPSVDVYAGFAVQLTAGSTNEAEVTVAQNTSAAIPGTSASYVYTTNATCDATAYGLGTNANGVTFDLAAVEVPTFLCFKVSADNTIEQGKTGTIVWSFTAASTDAI